MGTNFFENIATFNPRLDELATTINHIDDYVSEIHPPPFEETPLGEHFKKTEQYQAESLEILKSIQENTANLYTLVELISNSNDNQDEIIGILSEIFELAKAKSEEEADKQFKKVMTEITDTVEAAESTAKLVGWLTSIYRIVKMVLKSKGLII